MKRRTQNIVHAIQLILLRSAFIKRREASRGTYDGTIEGTWHQMRSGSIRSEVFVLSTWSIRQYSVYNRYLYYWRNITISISREILSWTTRICSILHSGYLKWLHRYWCYNISDKWSSRAIIFDWLTFYSYHLLTDWLSIHEVGQYALHLVWDIKKSYHCRDYK